MEAHGVDLARYKITADRVTCIRIIPIANIGWFKYIISAFINHDTKIKGSIQKIV
jgi:hypothetical protein